MDAPAFTFKSDGVPLTAAVSKIEPLHPRSYPVASLLNWPSCAFSHWKLKFTGVSANVADLCHDPSARSVPVSLRLELVRIGWAFSRMLQVFSESCQIENSASIKANAFFSWPSLKFMRPLLASI